MDVAPFAATSMFSSPISSGWDKSSDKRIVGHGDGRGIDLDLLLRVCSISSRGRGCTRLPFLMICRVGIDLEVYRKEGITAEKKSMKWENKWDLIPRNGVLILHQILKTRIYSFSFR